ncbi:transposase [Cellulosilyticum ruminicola]|uniref:transposase n=1 Tax=Cellulosilyticum ruminicola TaxID=425254 RepID=UPI0006D254B8
MADRGYASYNVLAHIQEKGWKYIIRVKDTQSKGMASTFRLPKGEFDKMYNHLMLKLSFKRMYYLFVKTALTLTRSNLKKR